MHCDSRRRRVTTCCPAEWRNLHMNDSTLQTGIPPTPRHDTFLFSFFFPSFHYSALGLIARRAFIFAFPSSLGAQRACKHTHATSGAQESRFISYYLVTFPSLPASRIPKDPSTYPFISFRTCRWSISVSCSLHLLKVALC
jgi:hypothetical protein